MPRPRIVLDSDELKRAWTRVAHQLAEVLPEDRPVALIGIQLRGVPLAHRLAKLLVKAGCEQPLVGSLDIGLYRDDLSQIADQPILRRTDIGFALDGKFVVLVDDVLYTGRTIRAALDALVDLGRPRRVLLATVIDRGGRELPIRADFVGRILEVDAGEDVRVLLKESDGDQDRVEVVRTDADPPARKKRTKKKAATRKKALKKKGSAKKKVKKKSSSSREKKKRR